MAGPRIIELDAVPSTLDIAAREVARGNVAFTLDSWPDPAGWIARHQTRGRGQRGRTWHSVAGESFCAALPAPMRAAGATSVSLAAAVASVEALSELVPLARDRLGIKWPNDLVLAGRKLGGILVEMGADPAGEPVALVGIGMNLSVKRFPAELEASAVSLEQAGYLVPRSAVLAADIARHLAHLVSMPIGDLVQLWRDWSKTTGVRYTVSDGSSSRYGTAIGVSDAGALVLRLDGGEEVTVTTATSIRPL